MREAAGRMDLEALLADALRPIDPPESLSSRVETTLSAITEQAAQALGEWADELSEGELEALRDPRNWVRPVAAIAVGSAAAGARWSAPAAARRPASALSASSATSGRSFAARSRRAGEPAPSASAPAASPVRPRTRWRKLSSVLDGDHVEDHAEAVLGLQEPPNRDQDVEEAERQRVGPRGVAGGRQADETGGDVEEVVPAVDVEDPEHGVGPDVVAGLEAGLVEESDDPCDHQRAAHERCVQPGWARISHAATIFAART